MKITARYTGGFAGLERHVAFDTACRPDGAALETLLRDLDVFCATPPLALGADLPRWEITVEDGERCRSLVLADDGSPGAGAWKALLAHLGGAL